MRIYMGEKMKDDRKWRKRTHCQKMVTKIKSSKICSKITLSSSFQNQTHTKSRNHILPKLETFFEKRQNFSQILLKIAITKQISIEIQTLPAIGERIALEQLVGAGIYCSLLQSEGVTKFTYGGLK